MLELWLKNLGLIGTGLLLGGTTLGLFWKADEAFSDEFLKAISNRLKRIDFERASISWPNAFAHLFDRVFGVHHLSWYCFFRSCLASLIAILLLMLIILTLTPELNLQIWDQNHVFLALLPIGFLVLNIFPDYVSLLETRYIIKWMNVYPSSLSISILLLLDLIATFIIFWFFGLIGFAILFALAFSGVYGSFFGTFNILSINDLQILVPKTVWPRGDISGSFYAIFFYSTFITSIWAWLYAFSEGVVRLSVRFNISISFFQWVLPIEKKPFRSIGEVAAICICFGYWAIAGIAWIFRQIP